MRAVVGLIVLLLAVAPAQALEPDAEALRWWSRCVGATEARRAVEFAGEQRPTTEAADDGSVLRVERDRSPVPSCEAPDGTATIERWRGTALVPGVTLDEVLHSLEHELPVQDDVLAARFLEQSDRVVRVQLRLVRKKIVTVVLDTEHEMTLERRSARLAFSRSVMTRATEIDAPGTPSERARPPVEQRGYLWRLNAYARYAEAARGGVLIEMETVTLSRSIPALLRPIAGPFIESVGRESMTRTLEGLRRRFTR